MSISDGYEKIKKYRKTPDGTYIEESQHTYASSVEFEDGTLLEDKTLPTYYYGTDEPDSSIGVDGDIYIKYV